MSAPCNFSKMKYAASDVLYASESAAIRSCLNDLRAANSPSTSSARFSSSKALITATRSVALFTAFRTVEYLPLN